MRGGDSGEVDEEKGCGEVDEGKTETVGKGMW